MQAPTAPGCVPRGTFVVGTNTFQLVETGFTLDTDPTKCDSGIFSMYFISVRRFDRCERSEWAMFRLSTWQTDAWILSDCSFLLYTYASDIVYAQTTQRTLINTANERVPVYKPERVHDLLHIQYMQYYLCVSKDMRGGVEEGGI
jgi:hypothetical protein